MGKVEWSKLFDSTYIKVFLMFNTVPVLMLADKYLTRKKQAKINSKTEGTLYTHSNFKFNLLFWYFVL